MLMEIKNMRVAYEIKTLLSQKFEDYSRQFIEVPQKFSQN